jgi:hypothetical protein
MTQTARLAVLVLAAALIPIFSSARADEPGTVQLRIVVTAVQGHAQVKLQSNSAWQAATRGMELSVGCQIRTGVSGTVQFTVGDDQVYRVDRLSLIQVIRADTVDGKIKTIVGMTYGRVSKDVDAPILPHEDSIVSPSATLAVRGTRVSLYDQPPYEPEAVSLTGQAVYQNFLGGLVKFGSHGGKAAVGGTASSAAGYRIQQLVINPKGGFPATTTAEQEELANSGDLGGTDLNEFSPLLDRASQFNMPLQEQQFIGGELLFLNGWGAGGLTTPTPFTVLDFSVTSPLGETVSFSNQSAPSGGGYSAGGSNVSSVVDSGNQSIFWESNSNHTFPAGPYTVTETLEGTQTQTLAQDPTLQVVSETAVKQTLRSNNGLTNVTTPTVTQVLNLANPTVTYTITAPLSNTSALMKK